MLVTETCFFNILFTKFYLILPIGEPDAGLSSDIIRDLLQTSIEMHLDPDGDATGTCLETCKSASGALTGELTRLAGMLGDDELDVVAANALKNQEKITPPILLRAHKVKKDMEEMKNMKHKLENKESDIKVNYIYLPITYPWLSASNC